MKGYLTNGKGIDKLKLSEMADPTDLSPNDVLVDVKACSLNYRDLLIAKGQYSPGDFAPFIPLSDMAGVVKTVGAKVSDLKSGDRVLNAPFRHWPAGTMRSDWARTFIGGAGINGVLAEKVAYPSDALIKIPEHLDFIQASTFTIAGLTAWAAVVTHGKANPGDWILLQGTGGVSIFAAQIAQMLGARAIMTTSNETKSDFVKKNLGVYATANYRDPNWPKIVKELTGGKGVDVVVDVVGGDTLTHSLHICAYGARVAAVGILDSKESHIHIMDLITHQIQLKGIFMESTEKLRELMKAVEAAKLKPIVDKVFDFADARRAYEYLESQKHIGKVVIKIGL
jgi:NADPH:quinone reductase-like Zn-dependent oxidoreductase